MCRLQLRGLGFVCRVQVPGSALDFDVVQFSFRLKTLPHMRRRIHACIPLDLKTLARVHEKARIEGL